MEKQNNAQIANIGKHRITTRFGRFWLHGFEASEASGDRLVIALTPQELHSARTKPLVRIQLSCLYSEAFGSLDCDCALQLDASMAALNASGQGALIYFPNTDSRGLGLKAKLTLIEAEQSLHLGPFMTARVSDVPYQDLECLKYVPKILEHLQLTGPIRLLSNNPEKARSLITEGLVIESMVPLTIDEQALSVEARREILEKRTLLDHTDTAIKFKKKGKTDEAGPMIDLH